MIVTMGLKAGSQVDQNVYTMPSKRSLTYKMFLTKTKVSILQLSLQYMSQSRHLGDAVWKAIIS